MTKFKEKNIEYYNYREFTTELVTAINNYGEEHIDAIIDRDKNNVYLSYHSKNDSFSVSKNYSLDGLNVIDIANNFNIGWSEI